jgi:hypothetical protein
MLRLKPTAEDLLEYDPLQLYRDIAGRMTQEEFCKAMGVSDRQFRSWWSGKRLPTYQVFFFRAASLRQRWTDRGWLG